MVTQVNRAQARTPCSSSLQTLERKSRCEAKSAGITGPTRSLGHGEAAGVGGVELELNPDPPGPTIIALS